MNAFATVSDVLAITGKAYTREEQGRIATLLPLISDALRVDAARYGWNLDARMMTDPTYGSILMVTTVDIVARAMRQSMDDEPMQQESESALGYSWSGTYAIPGGGVAGAIMNNDRKRLGYLRQRMGVIELYEDSRNPCNAI